MTISKQTIVPLIIIVSICVGIFTAYQFITTYQAHETFEGYCAWRGLVVESKSSDYGYCKNTKTGQEYKIVLYQNRWFLDGDLPCGFLCF